VTVPAFIGDEVSATAWRLIGVRATAVDKGNAAEAFEAALDKEVDRVLGIEQ
jgi:vacuolar-type H+-ATPase subunit F/Vma7